MRIGLVGCGLVGGKRCNAIDGRHEIVAVTDPVPSRAQGLAECIGAKSVESWKDVVAEDLEAVIVATPHNLSASITIGAIQAGRHVLVEKPGARSAAELAPVLEAAKRHRRLVKVGFNHRFHPAVMKARELIDSAALGPLLYIRGRYGHGGRLRYESEWRCDPVISGGGELIDQGSHLIDLSRWFLGDLSLKYASTPTYFWDTPVDDNCFLALRGDRNVMAWLHASWTEWKNMFSFEIFGRDGKLAIDGLGGSYGVERITHYRMLPEMGPPEIETWNFPEEDLSWKREFDAFAQAAENNDCSKGNLDDAMAALRIVDACYGRDGP